MNITYHKKFRKNFKKRITPYKNLNQRFEERLKLFMSTPNDSTLNDHSLGGGLSGYRSFSITGDIRVIYRIIDDSIQLYDIGTHNQVYCS